MTSYAEQTALQSLWLYTHNVARVLKPSQDGELAHAIHETLHYALDGEAQDYLLPEEGNHGEGDCGASEERTAIGEESVTSGEVNGALIAQSTAASQRGREDCVRPGFFPTGDNDQPYVSYHWDESRAALTLPHPKTVINPLLRDPCTSTEDGTDHLRDAFDVTAKFFYLGKAASLHPAAETNDNGHDVEFPSEWIDTSLQCLQTATGLDSVDTMILAFPTLELDCSTASDEQIHAKAAKTVDVWRRISQTRKILSLGLSDISRRSLQAIIEQLKLPGCGGGGPAKKEEERLDARDALDEALVQKGEDQMQPSQRQTNGDAQPVQIPSSPSRFSLADRLDEKELLRVYGPSECRRPRLCSINLREQSCDDNSLGGASISNTNAGSACWDRGLADYCKEQNVVLVAHSDQKDILPSRTLPALLREFEGRIPHPVRPNTRLMPVWALKYTVLIRDRGVLADKGFVLYCRTVADD